MKENQLYREGQNLAMEDVTHKGGLGFGMVMYLKVISLHINFSGS